MEFSVECGASLDVAAREFSSSPFVYSDLSAPPMFLPIETLRILVLIGS